MRVLKVVLLSLAALFVLLLGVGFFLPSGYSVERTVRVEAPPERIYPLIADPRQWPKWTVWNQRDPAMKVAFSGPASGPGAMWSWQSASEGTGSMEFTRVEPNRGIEYRLHFLDFDMKSSGALTLLPEAGATRVTWTNKGDVGANPLMRYFALLMDAMAGPDFEKGLARLKALAEKP
jgi:uncharacterized protein YndB with AHSA1/START domain